MSQGKKHPVTADSVRLFRSIPGHSKALPKHTREHNRSLVIRTLYQEGPQSRADLSRGTGLAKVTISDLVSELVRAGIVTELGTKKPKGPGKPAVIVDIAWNSFLILALDLSGHNVFRASLMNLSAKPVKEMVVPTHGARGTKALSLLTQLIADSIAQADRPVLGLGVASPGIVATTGTIRLAPNLGWKNLALQDILERHFSIPVVVYNDANAAALGHGLYEETADDFILITIGEGLGAGLVINRHLVQGSDHAVGEIGHVVVDSHRHTRGYDPERVLEKWLAVPALEKRLGKAKAMERDRVLRKAGEKLGKVLAPIVATLDLSEVLLSGPADLLGGPLLEATTDTVRSRVLPETIEDLVIKVNEDTHHLVMVGCAAVVLAVLLGVQTPSPATTVRKGSPS